jgi:hypothetical protein
MVSEDVATATLTGVVGAGGTATITIQTRSVRSRRVTQVTIELPTAPSGATCALRKNGYLVTPLIATGDTAAGDPPVILRQEDNLTVEWTGCTPNTVGKTLIFYEVL